MGLWYQDVLKGFGLTAVGATSAAAAGGGQLGALVGGVYGAIKAGTGGVNNFGTSWYQVAAPAAAGGMALYPSTKATNELYDKAAYSNRSGEGYTDLDSRLSVQGGYLGSQVANLFSTSGSGIATLVNKGASGAVDSVSAGGSWLSSLIGASGKGLTDFVSKGGLVPLLGGLKVPSFSMPNMPTLGQLPGATTIFGGATPQGQSGTVAIPVPTNNGAPSQMAGGGVPAWVWLIGLVIGYMLFGRKLGIK